MRIRAPSPTANQGAAQAHAPAGQAAGLRGASFSGSARAYTVRNCSVACVLFVRFLSHSERKGVCGAPRRLFARQLRAKLSLTSPPLTLLLIHAGTAACAQPVLCVMGRGAAAGRGCIRPRLAVVPWGWLGPRAVMVGLGQGVCGGVEFGILYRGERGENLLRIGVVAYTCSSCFYFCLQEQVT